MSADILIDMSASLHVGSPADSGLVPFDPASRARFRREGWWTGRSLPAELVLAAEASAGRPALVTPEVSWNYRDLLDEATRFGAGLARVPGVAAGEAVMFQMGNVAQTVVGYLGCLLAGARPVCTLPQHGSREIGLLAAHTGASCLIVQSDFRGGRLAAQARQLLSDGAVRSAVIARGEPFPGAVSFDDVLSAGEGAGRAMLPFNVIDPGQIAVFQLSGGTTGLPKIAPRLHEEYAYNSRAWAEAMGYGPDSVILYPLPVMHNAGISLAVQPAIFAGSRLVLAPSADIDELVTLIERYRPDVLPLVPPAVAIRLLESPRARKADLSSISDFVVGGQKLPAEIADRLRDELGIRVRQMFGMAEGMFTLTPAGAGQDIRHHTVGAPISPGDEVRILEPGGDEEIADGDIGELAARGPYTIRGYYRAAAHNSTAFTTDGFYRTGDLARRHRTGEGVFYSIEGRIKDVINRGVEKIHAEEVEELIIGHPSVAAAALVAMPDPVLGEKGCVYLVLEAGAEQLTVTSLGRHLLAGGLAKYKLPERVEIVPELPLTNVGKVSKKLLREDIERKLAAEAEEEET
jgi:2,3-dihydroxybenzoate-AMP ligase